MTKKMLKIYQAETDEDIDITKQLFLEYLSFLQKEFYQYADLPWIIDYYQDFEKEIDGLPGKYKPPKGCILLAEYDEQAVGCLALDEHSDGICEMKRLYIKSEFQSRGIGTALCKALIEQSKKFGYQYLRLATALEPAKRLYESLGFIEIPPFDHVPVEGVIYMELKLT